MTKSMTGFYPWVGYQVNERVSVWGVTGYGTGSLSLTPDGQSALETCQPFARNRTGTLSLTPDGQSALETGVSMAMSAVGTRGELIGSRATGGFRAGVFHRAPVCLVGLPAPGSGRSVGRARPATTARSRVRGRAGPACLGPGVPALV